MQVLPQAPRAGHGHPGATPALCTAEVPLSAAPRGGGTPAEAGSRPSARPHCRSPRIRGPSCRPLLAPNAAPDCTLPEGPPGTGKSAQSQKLGPPPAHWDPLWTGVMGVGKLKAPGSSRPGKPKSRHPTDTARGSSSSEHVGTGVVLPPTRGMCQPSSSCAGRTRATLMPASRDLASARAEGPVRRSSRLLQRAGSLSTLRPGDGQWGQRQRIPEPQGAPAPCHAFSQAEQPWGTLPGMGTL